jgi:hypothetical protein
MKAVMGMDKNEREVRDLLTEHGELMRTSGGHEIWRLPDSGIFPVKAAGRHSANSQTWRNALSDLRRELRARGIEL